jgi:flagellar biosynthesis repressor protein FlbT
MSALVLELRPNELMIINGAVIRFRTKTRVELHEKARFLFGKQVMMHDQADSPAKCIYFALQLAYVGSTEERRVGLATARRLIANSKAVSRSQIAREVLELALSAAEADDGYRSMQLGRQLIQHEERGRHAPDVVG